VRIEQKGVVNITAYPKKTIGMGSGFKFKGLELIPED